MSDLIPGLFFYDGVELFNDGRTLANVTASSLAARGVFRTDGLYCENDCTWDQNLTLETNGAKLAALAACLPACVTDAALNITANTTPSSADPWADATQAAAAEFLGFTLEDVDGLDGKHNSRTTSARLVFPKGSVLSPLRPAHRTITFQLVIWATSPRGLEYGMQWLTYLLATDCAECATHELTFQTDCSGDTIWRLLNVGLASGPEWGDPITDGMSKYARQATVAVYAGIPCIFSKPVQPDVLWGGGWQPGNTGTFVVTPSFNTGTGLTPPNRTFDWMPIVTIVAPYDGDSYLYDVQVLDPAGLEIIALSTLSIPGGTRLVIDSSRRKLFYYPSASDPDVVYDGAGFIDASAGFILWGSLACSPASQLYVTPTAPPVIPVDKGRWRADWVKRRGC